MKRKEYDPSCVSQAITANDVGEKLKHLLSRMPPLTLVNFTSLCDKIPEFTPVAVMTALDSLATGESGGGHNERSPRHALMMSVACPDNSVRKALFSLPGIPSDHILDDFHASNKKDPIVLELSKLYGAKTIEYWGYATQRRVVEKARRGMARPTAIGQKNCRICDLLKKHYPWTRVHPVSASHLLSRRALFWRRVKQVHDLTANIFSDVAVDLLKKKLKGDKFHYNEQYLLPLCEVHDDLFIKALSGSGNPADQQAGLSMDERHLVFLS